MDHIYPTKDYEVYKIKDETDKLTQNVLMSDMPVKFDEIAEQLNLSDEELKKISLDICRTYEDYGTEDACDEPGPFASFPKEALELNCVKYLKANNIEFRDNRIKDIRLNQDRENKSDIQDLEPLKDSIITIRSYEPYRYIPSMKNQPRFHQEFLVLGSNLLSELRDRFYCQCNYGPFFDISDDPLKEPEPNENCGNPGFFFIHDTFFNDTRNTQNQDYSEGILKWLKNLSYVRDFKTGIMETTRFEDLHIRVGYPCVYQHHGACEHLFCITSVDLLDGSDSLCRADYPLMVEAGKKRAVLCEICSQNDATFMVTNSPFHVKDPMKLCENCFYSFHYTDDVEKISSFQAYRMFSVRPE